MMRKELNIFTFLLLLAAGVVMAVSGCSEKEKPEKIAALPRPLDIKSEAEIEKRGEEEKEAAENVLPSDKYGREDPFDPVFARGSEGKANLILEGIVWDNENPKAMINNKIIGIGEQVRGNTVIDIREDRVILNDGTTDFELRSGEKR